MTLNFWGFQTASRRMGTNMLVIAEHLVDGRYEQIKGLHLLNDRDYAVFGFLADVRNEGNIPPLSHPRGIPEDSFIYGRIVEGEHDLGEWSWLSLEELTSFNYEASFEQPPRYEYDGAMPRYQPVEDGQGTRRTFREILGPRYFSDLSALSAAGATRIVFAFYP